MSTRSASPRGVLAARATSKNTSTTPILTCGELAASVFGTKGTSGTAVTARPGGTAGIPRRERRRLGDLAPSVLRLLVLLGVGSVVVAIALAALVATLLLIAG